MPTSLWERLCMGKEPPLDERKRRERYGLAASLTGMLCNVALFALKMAGGLLSGSIAVLADAFNNLSDAGSSVVSFVGFRMAAKPADREHPFGHGRIEYIAGLIVSFLILFVGAELFVSSIKKIFAPEELSSSVWIPIFLVLSIVIKLWMSVFYRRIGKKIESSALKAAAQDSLNDVIATAAVLISFVIFMLTGVSLDAYFGLAVSVFILIAGIRTARETISPLLGQAPDPALVGNIEASVLSYDGIIGVHDLIIHNYGPGRSIVSLHAEVSAAADILESHDTIDLIERELAERFALDVVVVHMDPVTVDDEHINAARTTVIETLHGIDPRLDMHDFRMVEGVNHTNLIFDVVIPGQFGYSPAGLTEELERRLQKIDSKFLLRVHVDRNY